MKLDKKSELLLKASFFGTFSESMWVPLYAMFVERVGGNILDAGIGYAIFEIVTGIIVITFGRSRLFSEHLEFLTFTGFTVAGFGDLLLIMVKNKYELFIVQVVIGIAVGILNPAWDALYSEVSEVSKWTLWSGGVTFFTGISALLAGVIVRFQSFRAMFLIMAIVNSYSIYCSYLIWRKKDDTINNTVASPN